MNKDWKPEFWITWRTKDGKKKLDSPECTTNKAYAEQHKQWEWIPYFHDSNEEMVGEAVRAYIQAGKRGCDMYEAMKCAVNAAIEKQWGGV